MSIVNSAVYSIVYIIEYSMVYSIVFSIVYSIVKGPNIEKFSFQTNGRTSRQSTSTGVELPLPS